MTMRVSDWQISAIGGFLMDNVPAFEQWLNTNCYEKPEDTAAEVLEYLGQDTK